MGERKRGKVPYSGLFSWVEIFVKSWKRPSELNFVVLNFMARYYTFACGQCNVNFELGTRDATFGFGEERIARLSPERVWLRETIGERQSTSVSSLAWEATSTKHKLHWGSHT